MKVHQLMRREPLTCSPDHCLAEVGRVMAEAGVGFLPAVDREGRLVGVITDRDVATVLARCDRRASELEVHQAMSSPVATCLDTDDVYRSLAVMKERRVRRLTVVDGKGALVGVLSLDDLVLEQEGSVEAQALASEVHATLRAVTGHPVPALTV